MAVDLHLSARDLPSCARYGFSARKIWIFLKGLLVSWLIWDIFIYLGYYAAGYDMAARWEQSLLCPLPGALFWKDLVPVVLLAAGLLLILNVMMRSSLRVSRITFQQLRGDNFFSGRGASRFTRKFGKPLVSVPILLVLSLGLALAAGLVTGLISGIPAVGPVISALLSIPLWGVMLLALLTASALLLGLMLLPAIVACTGGDTFESVFELYSTLTSQSWRLFLYFIAVVFFAISGTVVFLFFSSLALDLLGVTTSLGGGSGLGSSLFAGPQMLAPEVLPFFKGMIGVSGAASAGPWTGIPGLIAGVSGTLILLITLSYFLSSCSCGWTMIYLALRRRKDGVNLIERADSEEEREFNRLYGEGSQEAPVDEGQVDRRDK